MSLASSTIKFFIFNKEVHISCIFAYSLFYAVINQAAKKPRKSDPTVVGVMRRGWWGGRPTSAAAEFRVSRVANQRHCRHEYGGQMLTGLTSFWDFTFAFDTILYGSQGFFSSLVFDIWPRRYLLLFAWVEKPYYLYLYLYWGLESSNFKTKWVRKFYFF